MTINEDGSVAWQQFHPGNPNVMEMATVDMNGNVFIPDWLGVEMWSLDSAGNTRWVLGTETDLFSNGVGISPDNEVLVNTGAEGFDARGFIRGMNPNNGAILWRQDLEPEQGINQRINNLYPVFGNVAQSSRTGSRSLQTVYISTLFTNINVIPYGYLYAINYR